MQQYHHVVDVNGNEYLCAGEYAWEWGNPTQAHVGGFMPEEVLEASPLTREEFLEGFADMMAAWCK